MKRGTVTVFDRDMQKTISLPEPDHSLGAQDDKVVTCGPNARIDQRERLRHPDAGIDREADERARLGEAGRARFEAGVHDRLHLTVFAHDEADRGPEGHGGARDIPQDPDERIAWLHEEWSKVDQWICENRA